MKVFEASLTHKVYDYLFNNLSSLLSFELANQYLYDVCGIDLFFENNEEFEAIKIELSETKLNLEEPDRTEYGDFQTNIGLAEQVIEQLFIKNVSPKVIIEPTCGKGNFILASLKKFKGIKHIFGIEIYKPYVWETKFSILDYFLTNTLLEKPNISIIHCDVFDFDFKVIAKNFNDKEILIVGNPPWVTNAKLSSINSLNLPRKTNFKNHSGLDAMTGKGNFDIAEFITLNMINTFQAMKGNLALLVKNSVIKNIVFEQYKNKNNISNIEKYCIDSKKEFNVSVEASLLYCQLNTKPSFTCKEFNFYEKGLEYLKFGWFESKFVSDIDAYRHTQEIDGECPFVWRQGLKHDCSSIMELDKAGGSYTNGLNEEVNLEDALVYGLLKSSDLKNTVINQTRKYTIVTQKKVGQETLYIKTDYPKTYQYLSEHQDIFSSRKSSIYNNKPPFSIFGIGDYSFKPYKVAISGLYKTFHFTLILPQNDKAVMLDDTCYMLGFDRLEFAAYTLILLNSETTMMFLKSITFSDAKRTFTKDVLMRIDLSKLIERTNKKDLQNELTKLNEKYCLALTLNLWDSFLAEMIPANSNQLTMFA